MESEDFQAHEKAIFLKAANAFAAYRAHAHSELVQFRRDRIRNLPAHQQDLAASFVEPVLNRVEECILRNSEVADQIGEVGFLMSASMFDCDHGGRVGNVAFEPSSMDMDKVCSTFRQIAREWSDEGREERAATFGPVLEELKQRFPEEVRRSVRVVCPGSGLGRLPYEIAKAGFYSQGNEFSTHMLFTSNYILNTVSEARCHRIYPWVDTFNSNKDIESQALAIDFPDECPQDLLSSPAGTNFSMAVGEFGESFRYPDMADVVVTMFFLDTSPNIFDTVDTITRMTASNGVWINCGPLLWHYEDVKIDTEHADRVGGLDLTLDSLLELVEMSGWRIEKRRTVPTTYCRNPQSMAYFAYHCEFFVAIKL